MDTQNRYLEIARDDLVVFEDGVEQKVDTFQEATSPGVDGARCSTRAAA